MVDTVATSVGCSKQPAALQHPAPLDAAMHGGAGFGEAKMAASECSTPLYMLQSLPLDY